VRDLRETECDFVRLAEMHCYSDQEFFKLPHLKKCSGSSSHRGIWRFESAHVHHVSPADSMSSSVHLGMFVLVVRDRA